MFDASQFNAADGFQAPDRPQYYTVPWYGQLLGCTACTAREEARRVVPGTGPLDAEIALVGQNPGEDEDQQGIPFIGRAGEEMDVWLRLLGLDRTKVLLTNILKCHTLKNRPPRPREIETCETLWMTQELRTFSRVRVVLPLGRPALFGLVGKMTSVPDVMEPWWVKVEFEQREMHVVPLAHPAYLLRTPNSRGMFYERVLPVVKDYLVREVGDVYQRSALA